MPEHAEYGRQERQRIEDRGGDDDRAADPERPQRGRFEQQQARQADRDGEPGERDGLAAGRDGDLDGLPTSRPFRSSSRKRLTMKSE